MANQCFLRYCNERGIKRIPGSRHWQCAGDGIILGERDTEKIGLLEVIFLVDT